MPWPVGAWEDRAHPFHGMALLTLGHDMPAQQRLDEAFAAYTTHTATLGQASVIAHLPMIVFLEEARRAGVLPVYRDASCD